MKKKLSFVLAVMLTASVLYAIIPQNHALHNKVYANDDKQSMIAGVVVGGLKRDEMNDALTKAIEQWSSRPITLSDGTDVVTLDPKDLQFDIGESINRYESVTEKPWYAFWKPTPVAQISLTILPNDKFKQQIAQMPHWDETATYNHVIAQASNLKLHDVEVVVNELAADVSEEQIASVVETIPEEAFGINELIEPLFEFTIPANEQFSMIEALNGQEIFANKEALNFVASLLYSIALYTNGDIVERHSQHVIPPYLEPGIEAAVEKNGTKNLRFVNKADQPVQIRFTIQNRQLKAEAFAMAPIDEVTVRIEQEKEIEPRIIARYSNDLAMGRQNVIQQGKEGVRVAVYRTNVEEGEQLLGKDYYAPINRVILKSARVPEPEPEPVPVSTQVPMPGQVAVPESGTAGEIGTSMDLNSDGIADYLQQTSPENDSTTNSVVPSAGAEKFKKGKKYSAEK